MQSQDLSQSPKINFLLTSINKLIDFIGNAADKIQLDPNDKNYALNLQAKNYIAKIGEFIKQNINSIPLLPADITNEPQFEFIRTQIKDHPILNVFRNRPLSEGVLEEINCSDENLNNAVMAINHLLLIRNWLIDEGRKIFSNYKQRVIADDYGKAIENDSKESEQLQKTLNLFEEIHLNCSPLPRNVEDDNSVSWDLKLKELVTWAKQVWEQIGIKDKEKGFNKEIDDKIKKINAEKSLPTGESFQPFKKKKTVSIQETSKLTAEKVQKAINERWRSYISMFSSSEESMDIATLLSNKLAEKGKHINKKDQDKFNKEKNSILETLKQLNLGNNYIKIKTKINGNENLSDEERFIVANAYSNSPKFRDRAFAKKLKEVLFEGKKQKHGLRKQ